MSWARSAPGRLTGGIDSRFEMRIRVQRTKLEVTIDLNPIRIEIRIDLRIDFAASSHHAAERRAQSGRPPPRTAPSGSRRPRAS